MRLGFLVSGRGSNMLSIVQACEQKTLAATPAVVISSNQSACAMQSAREHGIPVVCLDSGSSAADESPDAAITRTLQEYSVDLVVLAGYMKKVGPMLLDTYQDHIINIHPSLLPRFGGKGMYGMRVHQAVLEAGEKQTGVTVHQVNEQYDEGRILAQKTIPVLPDDTVETLAERVLVVEHSLYKSVIGDIINGRIDLAGN